MKPDGLGSLDPNVLPLDAIELQEESSSSKIIAGRDEWRFGSAISGSKWVTGREYKAGDIVWNPTDKLTYVALVDNSSIAPDYTNAGVEGVTWAWIAGTVTGYVAGRGSWQKHADGTLVQWGSYSVSIAISSAYFGGFRSLGTGSEQDFPAPFIDTDYTITGSIDANVNAFGYMPIERNESSFRNIFTAVTSQTAATRSGRWKAIGRWK